MDDDRESTPMREDPDFTVLIIHNSGVYGEVIGHLFWPGEETASVGTGHMTSAASGIPNEDSGLKALRIPWMFYIHQY